MQKGNHKKLGTGVFEFFILANANRSKTRNLENGVLIYIVMKVLHTVNCDETIIQ